MYGPPGRSHDVADDAKGPVFVKLRKGSPKRNTRQIELIVCVKRFPLFFGVFLFLTKIPRAPSQCTCGSSLPRQLSAWRHR